MVLIDKVQYIFSLLTIMDAPTGVQGHAGFNKATADEVTGSFATSCGVWKQLR